MKANTDKKLKKYIFRNNKYLEINKPRKLSFKMNIKDLAPEYPEKIINKPKRILADSDFEIAEKQYRGD